MIVKSDTPEAREIWRQVAEVAKDVPEWVKPQVQKAAKESAKRIVDRLPKEREAVC